MLNISNEEFINCLGKEFNLYGKTIDGIKCILDDVIKSSERVIMHKSEKDFESLSKMLELYNIPTTEFIEFIKGSVKDEYVGKFKELELQGWYKLYDEIENSDILDEEKIKYKKEVMSNVADGNGKRESFAIIKVAIGVLGLLKAISSIGKTLNDLKDDPKTRRIKYKNKSI